MSEMNLADGVIRKGKQLVANPDNLPAARAFIAELRRQADEAERQASAATPYKAKLLMQNARAARRDADRIESTIPQSRTKRRSDQPPWRTKRPYVPSPWGKYLGP